MARYGDITMSLGELNRLKTVQAVIDGNLKPGRAAERLGISDRQLRRLVERHRLEGPAGLRSKRFGAPGNHRI
jgi:Helix-turn-helix domain